jgi:hypothetical protein
VKVEERYLEIIIRHLGDNEDNFVGVITQVNNAVVHGTYRTQYIIDIWDTEKSPILTTVDWPTSNSEDNRFSPKRKI